MSDDLKDVLQMALLNPVRRRISLKKALPRKEPEPGFIGLRIDFCQLINKPLELQKPF